MNDSIDKNEIRRAIDRLQAEHPCGIAYDPTAFVNMEAVNTIKECVDKIARRMMEDTEINIICEFAKLYLEGAKPTIIEKPHGEWIFHKYDKDYECSNCHVRFDRTQIYTEKRFENALWAKMEIYNFCPNCGAKMGAGDPDA